MNDDLLEPPEAQAPVLILGAGGNIGLHIARRLVRDDQQVLLSYRTVPNDVIELQMSSPDLVMGVFPLDARTSSALQRFFSRVREKTDRLHALINCVGPFMERPLLDTSEEQFDDLVQTNLVQAFCAARLAYPLFVANCGGRIIHFTFAGVEKMGAYARIAAYASAKAGLLSLTRSLAVQWAPKRITVNAIAPGIAATDPEDRQRLLADIPAGTPTHLEYIYQAVRFLLSEDAGHITGNNLTVSGGYGWR